MATYLRAIIVDALHEEREIAEKNEQF